MARWLDQGDAGCLALAAVLLAAAANTKDEDLVASTLVLLVGGVASLVRRSDGVIRFPRRDPARDFRHLAAYLLPDTG